MPKSTAAVTRPTTPVQKNQPRRQSTPTPPTGNKPGHPILQKVELNRAKQTQSTNQNKVNLDTGNLLKRQGAFRQKPNSHNTTHEQTPMSDHPLNINNIDPSKKQSNKSSCCSCCSSSKHKTNTTPLNNNNTQHGGSASIPDAYTMDNPPSSSGHFDPAKVIVDHGNEKININVVVNNNPHTPQ